MTMKKTDLIELHRLFEIQHGNKFDLNKMERRPPASDSVAFVGRSGQSNGIVAFVQKVADCEPFAEGLITVALGGLALSSFLQPRPFYTAQNV